MDLYDDEQEQQERPNPEGEDSATGLLPTAFFMGKDLQPGDICTVEVVKVYDDQVEVRYIPHGEDDEESSESEEMSEGMPMAEMEDEMMA